MGTLALFKQHDTALPLVVDLNYRDTELDLSDDVTLATPVVFIMTLIDATTPSINRIAATVTAVDTIAKLVTVTYQWRPPTVSPVFAGDTAIAGRYKGEFEFALTGGPATAPTGGYLTIDVLPDLG